MSRYIDADELVIDYYDDYETKDDEYTYGYVSEAQIDSAPSIDVVRCGECKKANTLECSLSYWDDDWGEWRVGYAGDNWYCADGERKNDQ